MIRAFLDFVAEFPTLFFGILAAILVMTVLTILLVPYPVDVEVAARSWRSSIAVERWQENQHGGWDVPQGGRVISQERKFRETETYDCPTTDNENKECSRDVYDDWYEYRIWEWTIIRYIIVQGEENPRWGDMTDIKDRDPVNPERFGKQSITFTTVFVTKEGKQYTRSTDQLTWEQFPVGQKAELSTNTIGMVLGVKRK